MRSVFSIRKFSSQNSRLVFQSKKPHWLIMKPCSYNMYSTYELNPKQEVDLMVATTSVRPDREMVMDFTIPFYYDTSTLLMKKPDPNEKKLFILAKPLRWEVNINDIDTLSAQNYFHFLLLLMSRIVSMGVTCIMPHTNMIAVSLVQERFLWFAKLIKLELTLNFICINVYVLQVMVCTAVVLVVSAFFLCITEQLSPYYKVHGTQGQQDFQHSFWYMFGALLTQGTLQPKTMNKNKLKKFSGDNMQ